ncbi:DUF5067 domain-containing protein [Miniphocaeibacter massiliensis]|uniref:DUF5067 domain-containing protein n=1 Tax=Miniphocaeibacter massiliensis TaxID=2041841 RepID=UPI000C1BE17B|nr:DUF5067 domain-containing protein [Miniphocaeibacter massiliensis]
MKKKLLILGLIMMMALTACGGKKATDEEKKKLNEYAEKLEKDADGIFKFKFDEEKGTFDMIIPETTQIINLDSLRENVETYSNHISEKIGEDFEVTVYYEDLKDSIIVSGKNGKIEKDNTEDFFKEHKDRYKPNSYETDDSYYKFEGAEISREKYTGDKIVVLKMTYKNKSNEAMNPWISFITDLNVVQDDGSTVVNLQDASGSLPSSYGVSASDILSKKIKPGAEIDLIVGYKLSDDTSDVKIIDLWSEGDKFEKIYTIN